MAGGGRSGDNDDGEQQGGGGGETIILVRGMKPGDRGYDNVKQRPYRWVEFHKVDLKQQAGSGVEKNCYPKLLTWMAPGEMFRAGPNLCIIGGLIESQHPNRENYTRACVLDITTNTNNQDLEWKDFQLPIKHPYSYPRCASLGGKIYHFDYPSDKNPPHPLCGPFWEFIWFPPEFADCGVSGGLVADPRNKRILVNLSRGDLYAYYPLDRTFQLVGSHVYPWSGVVALVDDIAYVYKTQSSDLLYAFDLSDGAKSLGVVWTSTVLRHVVDGVSYDDKLTSLEFDALFHVGNNNFWFALWSPDHRDNVNVYFFKFKVRRTGDKIICTPLALQTRLLESTCTVFDYLLLQEEACAQNIIFTCLGCTTN